MTDALSAGVERPDDDRRDGGYDDWTRATEQRAIDALDEARQNLRDAARAYGAAVLAANHRFIDRTNWRNRCGPPLEIAEAIEGFAEIVDENAADFLCAEEVEFSRSIAEGDDD